LTSDAFEVRGVLTYLKSTPPAQLRIDVAASFGANWLSKLLHCVGSAAFDLKSYMKRSGVATLTAGGYPSRGSMGK